MIAALIAIALAGATPPPLDHERLSGVIERSGLKGDVVATRVRPDDDEASADYAHVGVLPEPYRGGDDGTTWRWASVTKQITAVMVMQQVAAGRIGLDQPVTRYLPDFAGADGGRITIRQLLQHRSGLPNPDDSAPGTDGFSSFYLAGFKGSRDPLRGYCAGPPKGAPGGQWSYNNCDYLLLGAVLERVTGKSWAALFRERIARPARLKQVGVYPGERWSRFGTIEGKREPPIDLASFGAAGAVWGAPKDLLRFDAALMTGKLLPAGQLAELWRGDPALGYMALGQWSFTAPLKGCAAPVRIVERRGGIGGIEVRNFILPDLKIAVAVFSQAAPFDFGEIWQGKGFSHDLLAAAACSTEKTP